MIDSKKKYSREYIRNYIVQGASLALRFLSLLIVVPALSKNPEVYGIYALCVSVTVFMSYVDLGFLASATKYATESYSQGNRVQEMNFIGFGGFVTLIMALFLTLTFTYLSFNPTKLIINLEGKESISIASNLLLTLALSSPFIVLQRVLSIIFEIRLKGYLSKFVLIITNSIVIISTFYFFRSDNYLIVEYYIFLNSSTVVGTIILLLILKYRFNYDIIKLFKSFKFTNKFFKITKRLAYPSFLNMLSWVAFYELDQIVVGRFIGAKEVAFFAIGLTFAALFRSIFGIIFGPFLVRANYFVGNNDNNGLRQFLIKIVIISSPFTVLPTIAFSLISEPLILSWVGSIYEESILMAKLFSLLFTFSFISYIAGIYLTAKERIKELYIISIFMPFIYWLGILLTYSNYGILAFPIFKLLTILISIIYYIIILHKYGVISVKFLFYKIFGNLILPTAILIFLIKYSIVFFPQEKSILNFLIISSITGFYIVICIALSYFLSKDAKKIIKELLMNFIK
jgi:O-antigen/teichoic acid export membrane protein